MAAIAHNRLGDSGGGGVFDPVEMLQTIRRENAQLARHGERSGSVTWETLYGNMKTLYDYEKTQPSHYKRMIRQLCMWAKIKMLEHTKSYKALVGCYIFRDVDIDTILGPNSEYNLGYLFPAVLSAPQGRQWVQGGQTEVDDSYNHEGHNRSAWDEIHEFGDTHQVVAWSPEHEANREILPGYWYNRGAFERGEYRGGDAHPELNAPYGGQGEARVVSAEATPIESIGSVPLMPLATEVTQIEEGGGGGESKSKALVAHRAPPRVSASAFATDEEEKEARRLHIQPPAPNLPQGGGRKRRKKTRRKKKRKTKRLRRKKRKTKRRRKKKRTRRKR